MATVPGEVVYVVYGDEPNLFHARLLTGHIVGASWIVVSPSFDVFEEDISLANPDLEVVRFGRGPGLPPFGLRPEQLFDFTPVLAPAQITALVAEGGRLAGLEQRARGLAVPPQPPLPPPAAGPPGLQLPAGGGAPGGGAVVAAPAVGPLVVPAAVAGAVVLPVPGADGSLPATHLWVIADEEPGAGRALGDAVGVGPGPTQARLLAVKGKKALVEMRDGTALFVVMIAVADQAGFVRSWRGDDARVLPVVRVHGTRLRDWRDAARQCKQEDFVDFPIVKPRTARWCADYLVKDGGPALHHEVWRSRRRLQVTDFGVDMHDTLSKIAEFLGTYDQYDLANSAGVELLFRKMQLIEYYYDEKDLDTMNQNPRLPAEEARAFTGGGRPSSMVAPELLEHVSKELERVGGIKKNARKLREEQAAQKNVKPGKGGDGKGADHGAK
jgi:hypothetical protein